MKKHWLVLIFTLMAVHALADSVSDPLHGDVGIDENAPAPAVAPERNNDVRETRAYPMQPPVIPHSIRDYQLDKEGNKCLFCHDRRKAPEMKAPMISVTHYMDRDGQFLAEVSPRRYFCTQCHVPQHQVDPAIGNDFIDVNKLLRENRSEGHAP
jgi:nitrate reductase (cytochrome), electron transfer subunit